MYYNYLLLEKKNRKKCQVPIHDLKTILEWDLGSIPYEGLPSKEVT